jgi:hypothetical protein
MTHDENEQDVEEVEKKKKVRKRRAAGQLQATLDAFDELIADPEVKSAKRCDLLISKATILNQMSVIESEERQSAALAENSMLKEKSEADAQRIAELEQQVQTLQTSQHPVEVRVESNPELPLLRKQVAVLTAAIADFKESDPDTVALVAVKSALKDFDAAKPLLRLLSIELSDIFATMKESTESLESALSVNSEHALSPLNRAVLTVRGNTVYETPTGRSGRSYRSSTPDFDDIF